MSSDSAESNDTYQSQTVDIRSLVDQSHWKNYQWTLAEQYQIRASVMASLRSLQSDRSQINGEPNFRGDVRLACEIFKKYQQLTSKPFVINAQIGSSEIRQSLIRQKDHMDKILKQNPFKLSNDFYTTLLMKRLGFED